MKNKWLFIAGLSGLLCVAIGAFAAHGLSKVLEPKELAWIETGVRYQMFHTIAIFAIGILQLCRESLVTNKMANFAAGTWAYGILLFSGSLYALALGVGKFLVWVTPIGGTLFLIGWLCFAYGIYTGLCIRRLVRITWFRRRIYCSRCRCGLFCYCLSFVLSNGAVRIAVCRP